MAARHFTLTADLLFLSGESNVTMLECRLFQYFKFQISILCIKYKLGLSPLQI